MLLGVGGRDRVKKLRDKTFINCIMGSSQGENAANIYGVILMLLYYDSVPTSN